MSEKRIRRVIANRFLPGAVLFSLVFCATALLSCASHTFGQMIKATVAATPLESTSLLQWTRDFGYKKSDLYPLTLAATGCPFADVDISGVKVSLMLDTGTAREGFGDRHHKLEIRS